MTRQVDEHPTIRESTIPDTRRGGAEPQQIEEYNEPQLTGPSFHEFRLIRQFPAAGGEADIWLIGKDKGYFILKHYRLGIEPKLEVLEKVSEISHRNPKYLIRIFRHGFDEETRRWYEIQEYARNGSLKDLMKNHQVSAVQFRTIIAEISNSLEALHKNQILHLDLKPSNILVRRINPLNLILTDFGISTLLDTELSRQITSTKGTPMYWAPEQLGNVVGKEADYWALGVIALEILQGSHPFQGVNHNIILATLSTRGIAIPQDIQPKTAILLKGLLTRNPRKRWGRREVTEWLAGRQNIPVFYEDERARGSEILKPYDFRGEQFTSLKDLSFALIRDPDAWEEAKMHIGRGYLTRWLEKSDQYGPAVDVEKNIETYQNEDERLLFTAARFNPDIPFIFLGKTLDISSVAYYLERYEQRLNDEREKKILSMIFSGDLRRVYQIFTGITRQPVDQALISRMFDWLAANTRGIDEKKRLYEYLRVLREREDIGPPEEWDARAVLKLVDIRSLFLKEGFDRDAVQCETDLNTAIEQALRSGDSEPDLLVALASAAEDTGLSTPVMPCLKKAADSDIRVISLLFNKKTGYNRFNRYKRLRIEYETNLYSLSTDPWKETVEFWQDLFFILMSGKKFPLALSVSERVIEKDRTRAEGWVMRGVSLYHIGRVKEADYFLKSNIVQSSDSPLVWQIVGEYYTGQKQDGEAEKFFLRSIEKNPTHTGSLFGLIRIYSGQKRYHEIISLCERALEQDPDNQGLLLKKGDAEFALGRIPQATGTYERYLSLAPGNTGVLKCLARCQIKLKRNEEAEKSLNTLLEQGERDPQVFRLKAYLLLIAGKITEALSYLDMTLESEPGDVWTLRIKADAHISLKEYGPALACIGQILTLDPDNHLIAEKKGKILLSLGFFPEAAGALKRAIEGGRSSADLYIQYADALKGQVCTRYGHIPDQDLRKTRTFQWRVSVQYLDLWSSPDLSPDLIQNLGEAIDWYDRAQPLSGEEASLLNRKAIVLSLLRDFDQAGSLFERAITINRDEPAYLSNLAVMYIMKGDTDRGSALFLQGMTRFSKKPYFLDQCAGLYVQEGRDVPTALDLIEQAGKVNSARDPIILYHKFLVLKALKKDEDARNTAEQIRSIDPWFIFTE